MLSNVFHMGLCKVYAVTWRKTQLNLTMLCPEIVHFNSTLNVKHLNILK